MKFVTEEVQMEEHKFDNPIKGRITSLEETLNKFIKESSTKQKQSESLIWDIKKGYDRTFKAQASSIKQLDVQVGKIVEIVQNRNSGSLPSSDDVKVISPKEYKKEEVEVKKVVKELEIQRKVLESYVPPTSFLVALEKMPKYAKFMKDLLTNKAKFEETFIVTLNERCPFVLLNKIPLKERSIELDIGDLKPTYMFIELANKSTQYSKGIAQNVNVHLDKFVFPDDFVISGIEEDYKDFQEVFMDDFFVFDNTFDSYLTNLSKMLARCDETNLVLNWEKCYFMVKEGIVLGHKVSSAWIEVDKAKVDVIAKLPYPTNVLMKETKFIFDKDCIKAFNILKKKLTTTPIINSSDWNLDFELMCDASDYAVETVLGQMVDKKFKPVYYATKTVNDSPEHYTTTEKELLVVFYAFDKFWSYLVVSKTIIYTDHYALKIENPELEELDEEAIRDSFPNKHLMAVHIKKPEKDLWLKLFRRKLKTRWYEPYTATRVLPYGTMEVIGKDEICFKVNGHRLKKYYGVDTKTKDIDPLFHTNAEPI
ncbi:reverse transcriptase domain-containing protein [Tanacetum coccineum]